DCSWHEAPAILCVVLVLSLAAAGVAVGVELKAATNAAVDRYVKLTEERNAQELRTGQHLLWIDSLGEAERTKAYAELRQGQVKMSKLDTRDNGAEIPVLGGM